MFYENSVSDEGTRIVEKRSVLFLMGLYGRCSFVVLHEGVLSYGGLDSILQYLFMSAGETYRTVVVREQWVLMGGLGNEV